MKQLLLKYKTSYNKLIPFVMKLKKNDLFFSKGNDYWSIQDHVVHLADSEVQSYIRIRSIICENHPLIYNCEEELWRKKLNYSSICLKNAFELINMIRNLNYNLLLGITPSLYNKTGKHYKIGDISLKQLVIGYTIHVKQHMKFINRNLKDITTIMKNQ